jgi:hypothetical protein
MKQGNKLNNLTKLWNTNWKMKDILLMKNIPFYMDGIELGDPLMEGWPAMTVPTDEEYDDMMEEEKPELDEVDEEYCDNFINAKIMVDCSGKKVKVHVAKHARTDAGQPIGQGNANPFLDTHKNECIMNVLQKIDKWSIILLTSLLRTFTHRLILKESKC